MDQEGDTPLHLAVNRVLSPATSHARDWPPDSHRSGSAQDLFSHASGEFYGRRAALLEGEDMRLEIVDILVKVGAQYTLVAHARVHVHTLQNLVEL